MATTVNFGTEQYFGFDPRMVPSMALWLDAADSNAITTSAGVVTNWIDKSGGGRNATPVGAPTLLTNSQNGLSVVNFNGSQNFTCPLSLGTTDPLTMFIVARSDTTTGFRAAISLNSVPGARGNSLMLYLSGTGFWWFSGGNVSTDGNTSTLALSTSRYDINANYWRPSFTQMNINGTAYASSTASPASIVAGSTMMVGRAQGTPAEFWLGRIGEILVFSNTLSQSQRQQIEGYLAAKWGLRANLPTAHPYRTLAPVMRIFQPVDVESTTLLWLDAADTRTITGSPVTLWTDKSGRGSNATTGDGSVVSGTAINSLNTLRFGLNTRLYLSNFVMPTNQTSVFYSFRAVTSNTGGGGTGYFIFSRFADNFSTFSGNEQFFVYQNPGAGRSYIAIIASPGERNWGNLPITAFSTGVNVISTTGSSYASSNGTSLPLVATPAVSNTVFTSTVYQISTSRTCCSDVFTYDLGELIVCDGAVSTAVAQQMEGYLARKWGVQGSLPTTHPYRFVLPASPLFVPHSISNCALWFDAADTATITGTTQITSWTNKGTLGGNATNRTGSCTSGNTVNGLNFVRCPAGTDLNFTAALATQARSWFFVARKTPALPGASTFSAIVGQPGTTGQDAVVLAGINATTTEIGNGPSGIAPGVTANAPSATLANVFVGALINSTTLASNVISVNGTVLTTTGGTAAGSYATGSLVYLLGGRAAYNQSIDIMEVLFYYGALTPTERYRVEGYLAWKWNLYPNLPSSHPYSKFRP